MKKLYLRFLQYLCRKELKRIADKEYPRSRKDLIRYYECMAIECINQETTAQRRILGVSVSTAMALDVVANG